MLEFYGGSVVKALLEIYPNIDLDGDKFLITTSISLSSFLLYILLFYINFSYF